MTHLTPPPIHRAQITHDGWGVQITIRGAPVAAHSPWFIAGAFLLFAVVVWLTMGPQPSLEHWFLLVALLGYFLFAIVASQFMQKRKREGREKITISSNGLALEHNYAPFDARRHVPLDAILHFRRSNPGRRRDRGYGPQLLGRIVVEHVHGEHRFAVDTTDADVDTIIDTLTEAAGRLRVSEASPTTHHRTQP